MYRFALRPRWIASHLIAVVSVLILVNLGMWQLRRHDERVERNAVVEARIALPVQAVEELLADGASPDELRFRGASATGRYVDAAVQVDNRSRDGLPGVWVLSPLRLADGSTVVVNRGFLPTAGGRMESPPPPVGPVTVTGTLVLWDERDCGTRTDDAGDLAGMACLRRDAVDEQLAQPVEPVVLQAVASQPAEDPSITPVPLPELTEGTHRSYAVQWFTFATLTAIVYALILRKAARDRARPAAPVEPTPAPV